VKPKGYIIKKLIVICVLAVSASFQGAVAPALFAESSASLQGAVSSLQGDAVNFRDFPWGTSLKDFTAKMGKPVHQEEREGITSLIYENIEVSGFPTYMLVYFSKTGLEGGTHYFLTNTLDELMQCYLDVQKELVERYGPTQLQDGIIRERRPYETAWDLPGGYVYLKVNTRLNEPVTLWYSSPALTKKLLGR
jgi:hypothetical protein